MLVKSCLEGKEETAEVTGWILRFGKGVKENWLEEGFDSVRNF